MESHSRVKESSFQIRLSGDWTDYEPDIDKILKRAFLAGFPNAKYCSRGQQYQVSFERMKQENLKTGKVRDIRLPYKWKSKAPAKPICRSGPTLCISVPPGSPGTTIQVPHPRARGQHIQVRVPATAKVGQAMLVPIPEVSAKIAEAEESPSKSPSKAEATSVVTPLGRAQITPASAPGPSAPKPTGPPLPEPSAPPAEEVAEALADVSEKEESTTGSKRAAKKTKGYSTGAKVAMGVGGVAAAGGLAVAGALLGEHIAEEGWDATMAGLGDAAATAGDHIASGAEAAVDWTGDAVHDAGDFIIDLF
eukprot:TRINITY_DN22659_c0_g1_i1.p1 TRINITY_DN22659_c0_g1~~TRINITY_DN22659_c0_g1_i1.p1  ORF type:complete len:307 (+),score=83.27 TRINITY_DN22659_c0_g1_i1:80-1000(+)